MRDSKRRKDKKGREIFAPKVENCQNVCFEGSFSSCGALRTHALDIRAYFAHDTLISSHITQTKTHTYNTRAPVFRGGECIIHDRGTL